MMGEAAGDLISSSPCSPPHRTTPPRPRSTNVMLGEATDADALTRLAERLTSSPSITSSSTSTCSTPREQRSPSSTQPASLRYSVDKAFQRRAFANTGCPCHDFSSSRVDDERLAPFLDELGDATGRQGESRRLRRARRAS